MEQATLILDSPPASLHRLTSHFCLGVAWIAFIKSYFELSNSTMLTLNPYVHSPFRLHQIRKKVFPFLVTSKIYVSACHPEMAEEAKRRRGGGLVGLTMMPLSLVIGSCIAVICSSQSRESSKLVRLLGQQGVALRRS